MNIFEKLAGEQAHSDRMLGSPTTDKAALERRLTYMASLTGGNGFRIPALSSNGKRAEKKSEARARAERQHRKELEIGVDPVFKPARKPSGVQARADWQKREKAWEQANG